MCSQASAGSASTPVVACKIDPPHRMRRLLRSPVHAPAFPLAPQTTATLPDKGRQTHPLSLIKQRARHISAIERRVDRDVLPKCTLQRICVLLCGSAWQVLRAPSHCPAEQWAQQCDQTGTMTSRSFPQNYAVYYAATSKQVSRAEPWCETPTGCIQSLQQHHHISRSPEL